MGGEVELPTLDWGRVLGDLGLLTAAFVLALPVAWDRYRTQKPAGLRTVPIVSVASCAFVLLGVGAFEGSPGAQARIIQGLMTGIGFIGGGAILKDENRGSVRGIATAASIWTVGAIGAATAMRRFELALVLGLANYAILRWLRPTIEVVEESAGGSE